MSKTRHSSFYLCSFTTLHFLVCPNTIAGFRSGVFPICHDWIPSAPTSAMSGVYYFCVWALKHIMASLFELRPGHRFGVCWSTNQFGVFREYKPGVHERKEAKNAMLVFPVKSYQRILGAGQGRSASFPFCLFGFAEGNSK